MFEDDTVKKRQIYCLIVDRIGLPHVQLHLSVFKAAIATKIYCKLGHHIDAKTSPKAASEKTQTTVSENRYTSPNIDVFWTTILTLIAPTGDNARASFLVHQGTAYLLYSLAVLRNIYAVFPPHLSV